MRMNRGAWQSEAGQHRFQSAAGYDGPLMNIAYRSHLMRIGTNLTAVLDKLRKGLRRSSAIGVLALYLLLAAVATYPFLSSPQDTLTAPAVGCLLYTSDAADE